MKRVVTVYAAAALKEPELLGPDEDEIIGEYKVYSERLNGYLYITEYSVYGDREFFVFEPDADDYIRYGSIYEICNDYKCERNDFVNTYADL